MTKEQKLWDDCRTYREKHVFYIIDKEGDVAECANCKKVLFRQEWWAYSDDGLEYNGLINSKIIDPEHRKRLLIS
jgi:hypothetical protein